MGDSASLSQPPRFFAPWAVFKFLVAAACAGFAEHTEVGEALEFCGGPINMAIRDAAW